MIEIFVKKEKNKKEQKTPKNIRGRKKPKI